MTKIGKLWTAGIAYVALAIGAGLSILYNVVDTLERRQADMDMTDWVTAVGAPAIVVIMVELFVSRWWIGQPRSMQALRWLGCLVIGGVAMRTSWTHGHDLMAGRGQAADVAIMWPLAIDLLAVMATALILAGRRVRGQVTEPVTSRKLADIFSSDVSSVSFTPTDTDKMSAKIADLPDASMSVSGIFDGAAVDAAVRDILGDFPPVTDEVMATRPDGDLDAWQRGYEDALATAVVQQAESFLSESLPRRTRTSDGAPFPAEFADMAAAWDPGELARADMVRLSAAHFEVTERTVRRWLAAWADRPTSGAE